MKVPESFIRKQTMVNYERFVTTTLKDLEESLIGAQDLAIQREQQLYQLLLESLLGHVVSLQDLAKNVAFFDLIISYAWLALEQHYSLPEIHQQDRIELIKSRHPVVEAYVGTHQFVANDIVLDSKAKQMIITGPNMAGKSTVMRQTALCAILCQIGSFVPADKALLPVFDNIFTRIGASDDLSRGLSTFMVEMQESSHILRHTGEHSLVILDEVGRGTSTEEGIAIATAVLEHISTKLKSWTLFATHYHEIVATFASSPLVTNYKTEAIEKDDSIQFTYRLVKGSTGYSFGLEVAKQADFPDEVLDRARFFIKDAKQAKLEINEAKLLEPQKDSSNYVDLKSQEIMSRLSQININRTTPLQAFQLLHELVLIHQKNPQDGLFQDGQFFF
jgi:DNA mismatch repair protein MutS